MSDTAVARTPSVTPDLGTARSSFSIAIPPRLSSVAPAPPVPSTSAAIAIPAPRRAAAVAAPVGRDFIDLTGPSPPTRMRDFPQESLNDQSGQRRSKRARIAASAPHPETVVLSDSDSDDDDDIIVVNPIAGPSGSSSADSAHSTASSTGATVASSVGGHQRGFSRRSRAVVLPAGGRRGAPPPLPEPALPTASRLGLGGCASASASKPAGEPSLTCSNSIAALMSAISRLTGAQQVQPTPANAAVRRTRAADHAPNSRASSTSSTSSTASATERAINAHLYNRDLQDDFIDQQMAAMAAARGDFGYSIYGHFFGGGAYGGAHGGAYGGAYDHLPTGLQGVIPGWKKPVSPGKKYGVRMSHPRRVDDGFARNIVNPPEDGELPAPVPVGRGKGKRAVVGETEPACASCLEPLRLAQAGEGRIWVLCCGHAVCGKCLGEARTRCEEIKAAELKNRWSMDVDGKGKGKDAIVLDDDDDDHEGEDEEQVSKAGQGRAKAKGKVKGKEKSRASETGVEEAWTTCPVVECDGALSDLLAGDNNMARPFEAYV